MQRLDQGLVRMMPGARGNLGDKLRVTRQAKQNGRYRQVAGLSLCKVTSEDEEHVDPVVESSRAHKRADLYPHPRLGDGGAHLLNQQRVGHALEADPQELDEVRKPGVTGSDRWPSAVSSARWEIVQLPLSGTPPYTWSSGSTRLKSAHSASSIK